MRTALGFFLFFYMICAVADSSQVSPGSYNSPNTYIYDAHDPYPIGYYRFVSGGPVYKNASCPSGTLQSTTLLYGRQYYDSMTGCDKWYLGTGNNWGRYKYQQQYSGPIDPMDAYVMVYGYQVKNNWGVQSSWCRVSTYIRYHWNQGYQDSGNDGGNVLQPNDCNQSIMLYCDSTSSIYNFYPVQYSTSSSSGFTQPSGSSNNYISFVARVACTM